MDAMERTLEKSLHRFELYKRAKGLRHEAEIYETLEFTQRLYRLESNLRKLAMGWEDTITEEK